MKTSVFKRAALMLVTGSVVMQSCAVNGVIGNLVTDCFSEDSVSAHEYDDMNAIEQLLYEENDCGRYEPLSVSVGDLLWPFD